MAATHVVASAEAASVLARGRGTHYLGPYFDKQTSVAVAARELSEPLAKVHYWTHRWHDLGLLEVTEVLHRKGRPIKMYRTIADVFDVPPELLPDSLLEAQLGRANRELQAALQATEPGIAYGGLLRIHKASGHAHVSTDRVAPNDTTARRGDVLQTYFTAELTQAEAKQLRDELAQFRDRWLQRADRPGPGTHIVLLAISPMPPR